MVIVFHSTIYASPVRGLEALAGAEGLGGFLLAFTTTLSHGVTIFFVISGYCITATADATLRRRESIVEYFKRRVRRIFPPYWTMLAITGLAVTVATLLTEERWFSDPVTGATSFLSAIALPSSLNRWQWFGNLSLTEFWRARIVWRGGESFILGPAWTLCYEEQFYAVTGLLLLASASIRRFFLGATVVTAVTLGMQLLPALPTRIDGFFFDGAWLLFACGVLVYYVVNYATTRMVALAAGGLCLPVVAVLSGHSVNVSLAIGAGFALVLLALHRFDARLMRNRALAPLRWCGVACYSIYLIHWPVTKAVAHILYFNGLQSPWLTLLVTVPACVMASLLLSWPFHVYVERRFLNSRASPHPARASTDTTATGSFKGTHADPSCTHELATP